MMLHTSWLRAFDLKWNCQHPLSSHLPLCTVLGLAFINEQMLQRNTWQWLQETFQATTLSNIPKTTFLSTELVSGFRTAVDDLYIHIRGLDEHSLRKGERLRRVLMASVWFSTSLGIACLVPNIGTVIRIIGSLAALFIFVFPGKPKPGCVLGWKTRDWKGGSGRSFSSNMFAAESKQANRCKKLKKIIIDTKIWGSTKSQLKVWLNNKTSA